MKKIFFLFIITISLQHAFAQSIQSYTADDLIKRVSNKDTTYIVNFWATWCLPCISELPEFTKLYNDYKGKPVKVLMVSCNLKEEYPNKLQDYISRKNILQEVVWLSDTDIDHYRPAIDERWSGQIPSTIIFDNKKKQRYIIEEIITADEIEKMLDEE